MNHVDLFESEHQQDLIQLLLMLLSHSQKPALDSTERKQTGQKLVWNKNLQTKWSGEERDLAIPKPGCCFLSSVFFSTGLFFFKQRAVGVRGHGEGGCEAQLLQGRERERAMFVCVCVCVCVCVRFGLLCAMCDVVERYEEVVGAKNGWRSGMRRNWKRANEESEGG